jgi:hypothetical protein
MPQYPGIAGATVPVQSNASPIALQKGEYVYVFGVLSSTATQLPVNDTNVASETLVAGTASIAVDLQAQMGDPPPMVCVELHFDGAPGAFEVDIQEADTDADAFYILPSATAYTVNVVVAATQNARVDLSPTGGKFMRLLLKTLTNAVKVRAKITRLA